MSSRSGSGPGSGSYSSVGSKSSCTPSRPPASSTWLTTSSSSEIAWPPVASPRAIERTAMRKDSTWSAICWANSSSSGLSCPSLSVTTPCDVSAMNRPPSFECSAEGDLVGVLKVPTHRKSTREPGHTQPHADQEPGEVRRGGLALQVGVGGQDDLGHRAGREPGHELLDAELVGADVVDGRDRPAEHVVAALELARPLDRDDVLGLLHHADDGRVAPRVPADAAGLLLG